MNFKSQEETKLLDTCTKEQKEKNAQILILQNKLKDFEGKNRDLINKLAGKEQAIFQLNEQINVQNSQLKSDSKILQNSKNIFEVKSKSTSLENQNNITSSTLYQDLDNDSQIKINYFQGKQAHSKSHQKLKLQGNLDKICGVIWTKCCRVIWTKFFLYCLLRTNFRTFVLTFEED